MRVRAWDGQKLYAGTDVACDTQPGVLLGMKVSGCETQGDGGQEEVGKKRDRALSTPPIRLSKGRRSTGSFTWL